MENDFLDLLRDIIIKPRALFRNLQELSWSSVGVFIGLIYLFVVAMGFVFGMVSTFLMQRFFGLGGMDPFALVLTGVYGIVVSIVGGVVWLVFTSLVWLVLLILRAKINYGEFVKLSLVILAIGLLASLIPYLGALAPIYALVLFIFGLRDAFGVSWGKIAAGIIIPIVLATIVLVALAFVIIAIFFDGGLYL